MSDPSGDTLQVSYDILHYQVTKKERAKLNSRDFLETETQLHFLYYII